MLDHLVGRPSANWKRTQVLLIFLAGISILTKGNTRQLPRFAQRLNKAAAGQAPWKIAMGSWMAYYLLQNLFLLVGLNAPEPLARLYKRSFYRATWILTALDAGFFTAMPLKPAWLRHICSILFSVYYLVFADAADEKVRRVRATINVDQMRLSWEKGAANPFLSFVSKLLRAPLTIRRIISVERPLYHSDLPPTEIFVFYAAHPDTFAQQNTVLLQFPGGGFVSMPPTCHEDALAAWANQTGLPIVSVNYKKAPEHPYPWPVEECFDFYVQLVQSKGRIIGLSGDQDLRVIIIGDSAGGNLTAAVTLKILAHNELVKTNQKHEQNRDTHGDGLEASALANTIIPLPIGLILIYPALDFEMTCWMTPFQLSLIRSESTTSMIRSKSLQSLLDSKDHLSHASPLSVVPDVDKTAAWKRAFGLTPVEKTNSGKEQPAIRERVHHYHKVKSAWETSRLAMTSRMSFFNDRIITAEMMRAMAILYLGPHAYPDFQSDYLLSPIVAPAHLLAEFPKTYMICGEKDPFVDDTVIFGGRIRKAKQEHRRELHEEMETDEDFVRVKFLEGMSHAFLQMMAFLPEAHQATRTIGDWVIELAQGTTFADGVSDSSSTSSKSESTTFEGTPAIKVKAAARNIVEKGAVHVAEMVTTEKDMLNRRKAGLVSDLLSKKE